MDFGFVDKENIFAFMPSTQFVLNFSLFKDIIYSKEQFCNEKTKKRIKKVRSWKQIRKSGNTMCEDCPMPTRIPLRPARRDFSHG